MSTTSVGQIGLDLKVNNNNLSQQITNSVNGSLRGVNQTVSGSLSAGFAKLGKFAIAAFAVDKVVSFGKACIGLGSDLKEVQNVVDVTFGKSASEINSWAKTTAKAYGVSELSAKQYSGTMGAMLKSMGITTDASTKMSKNLAGLAGDMASFYNLDTDEAFAKIRAGISGETEPLKQLGINMSVANLEAYALKQGITKAYTAMSQSEQAILRYNYLLSVTKDAQGDFARTSDEWANQVRVLGLNFDSLKATLGQILIKVLVPFVRQLNRIAEAANGAAVALGNLFGLNTEPEGVDGLVDGATETQEALEGANKAATALKKSLAGFDKLNILGSSNSQNSGSDGASKTPEVADPSTSLDKTQEKVEETTKSLGKFGKFCRELFQPFVRAWNDTVRPSFERMGEILGNLWKKHLSPMVSKLGYSLKQIVIMLSELLAGLSEILSVWGKSLVSSLSWLVGWISDILGGLFVILGGLCEFLTGVFTLNWAKAWEGVKNIFKGVWDSFVGIVKTPINLIIDAVNLLIRGLNKISIDVPEWVQTLTGTTAGKWGINIPEIPHLATGAYVKANTPQLAVIGDNKNEGEYVLPESKLHNAVASEVAPLITEIRQLIAAISRGGGGGNGQTIKLYVDGKQLFEWFVRQNNSIVRQTGRSPLKT